MNGAELRSRRRLLTGGIAAALVAATGLPAHALGRRGGLLTAGLSADGYVVALGGALGVTLTEISGDGSLVPSLAESWQSTDAGQTWSIVLRHESPGAVDLLSSLGEVKVRGRDVTLRLDAADPNLPIALSAPDMIIPGEPGLYRILDQRADRVELGRLPSHWKDEQAGWADQIILEQIETPALRLAALRMGRVDVIDGLDPHARQMLAARADVTMTGDLAVSDRVGLPSAIGALWPLDNGRMVERWWLG